METVVVGIICLVVGAFMGVVLMALMVASHNSEYSFKDRAEEELEQ